MYKAVREIVKGWFNGVKKPAFVLLKGER